MRCSVLHSPSSLWEWKSVYFRARCRSVEYTSLLFPLITNWHKKSYAHYQRGRRIPKRGESILDNFAYFPRCLRLKIVFQMWVKRNIRDTVRVTLMTFRTTSGQIRVFCFFIILFVSRANNNYEYFSGNHCFLRYCELLVEECVWFEFWSKFIRFPTNIQGIEILFEFLEFNVALVRM